MMGRIDWVDLKFSLADERMGEELCNFGSSKRGYSGGVELMQFHWRVRMVGKKKVGGTVEWI